jgi:hypothetical protein
MHLGHLSTIYFQIGTIEKQKGKILGFSTCLKCGVRLINDRISLVYFENSYFIVGSEEVQVGCWEYIVPNWHSWASLNQNLTALNVNR